MKNIARAIVLACVGCNVGFLRAASEYPNVAAGDTVTVSSDRTETSVTVAGTLIVTGGKVAQAAATTVTFGSPAGSAAPALIKVTGGAFGVASSKADSTTVNLGAGGGSGSFLVTGGALGVADLNIASDAAGSGGYIDFARLEGGKASFRRCHNASAHTARITIAGTATLGVEHHQSPTMYNGNSFEIHSEDGSLIDYALGNANPNMNESGNSVRLTGDADVRILTQYSGSAKFNKGFSFSNQGSVTFDGNGRDAEFRINASNVFGSGVTNLYLRSNAYVKLNGSSVVACLRDVTATSASRICGTGIVEADAGERDIAMDVPFADSVALRKIGDRKLTLGTLATLLPELDVQAGNVTVLGCAVASNVTLRAGSSLTVDGGVLEMSGDGAVFESTSTVRKNGGRLTLKISSQSLPVLGEGACLEVDECFIDGVAQSIGEFPIGAGKVRVAAGAYPLVPYGQTVTVAENHDDPKAFVRGHLLVTSGTSAASSGTSVSLGSLPDTGALSYAPAVIEVRGGLFGAANNNTPVALTIGADGGRGRLVAKGGELRFSTVAISENAAADESGYVDYGRVEGGVLRLRSTANNSASTGRVVFASNAGTLAGEHGWGATTYTKGSFAIESLPGARIAYQYANQHATFNASGVNVWLRGTGDMVFLQNEASSYINFNKGCLFDSAGALRFSGRGGVNFRSSGLVGPNVTGIELTGGACLSLADGTVTTVRGIASDAASCVSDSAATLVLDATAGDVVFDVPVRGVNMSLVKDGAGGITFGAHATNAPNFSAAAGGSVRILGSLTTGTMKLGGTSEIVVDGGRLTVGPGFEMAGGTVSKTNGGSIVVHAASGHAPAFPAGSAVTVDEYWLDGVRQANGTYTLGGATLTVDTYDESALALWTNESATQTAYAFASGSRYLGMLLKTPPASMSFAGDGVVLGSSGIAVDDTAGVSPSYVFDLPVYVGKSQKWAFGSASATFNGPLHLPANGVGIPSLEISSDADLTFAGTNSSFCGNVVVTGRNIRVTGVNALGTGTHGGTLTLKVFSYDKPRHVCAVDDAVIDQPVSFAVKTDGSNVYSLQFGGKTNILRGFAAMPTWTQFHAGSTTIFDGGCSFSEYTRQNFMGNATAIVRGELKLDGYWASRCIHPASNGDYLSNRLFIDCPVVYSGGASSAFKFYLVAQVHFLRDFCFSSGWITSENASHANAQLHLNGHPQRLERFDACGVVTSTNAPAALVLDYPAGAEYSNAAVFAGFAGVRKIGAGTAVFTGQSTSRGKIEAESGVLEFANTWRNASEVAVSGTGVLKVSAEKGAFGPNVTMRLSGAGGIELPSGAVQRVGELYLNGSEAPARPGTYTAANTGGLVRSGSVVVGMKSTALIIR